MSRIRRISLALCLVLPLAGLARPLTADDKQSDYRDLQVKFAKAYDKADYKSALDAAEKLHELRPGEQAHIYNVACMNCLLGHKDKAYDWLDKLADAGFKDADGLLDDYDFRTMRAEPRFRRLIKRIREGKEEKKEAKQKSERVEKSQKEEKKSSDDDKEPQRKIVKLNEEKKDKDAIDQDELRRKAQRIGQLTQELVETSPKDKKKALKIGQESYDTARELYAAVKDNDRFPAEVKDQFRYFVSLTAYNTACMHSLLNQKDEAFEHLDVAIEYGKLQGRMLEQIEGDSDIDNLRSDKRYSKVIKELGGKVPANLKSDSKSEPKRKSSEFKEELPDVPQMSPQERYQTITRMTQELIQVSNAGKRDEALDISLKAAAHAKILYDLAKDNEQYGEPIRMQFALTNYNVACMYSLLDNKEGAIHHLDKAMAEAKHFPNSIVEQMEGDSDLDNIRKTDDYKRILAKAKKALSGDGDSNDASEDTASTFEEKLPEVPKDLSLDERGQAVDRLTNEVIRTSQAGKKKEALKLALTAVAHVRAVYDAEKDDASHGNQVKTTASLTDYNAACMYSLLDNKEAAVFYLKRSAENAQFFPGDFKQQMDGDSDLDNIRDTSGYKSVAEKISGNARRRPSREPEPAPNEEKEVEFKWNVTLPENYNASKAAPLVVVLHHYHGNMERTAERWKAAIDDAGAILLTPQGTVQLGDDMYHWGRDLNVIERNVMKAINKVMDEHKVDQKKIVLAGFSQGGWATWGIALRNPDTFCGIIPVCGACRTEGDSAFDKKELGNLRAWIMLGEDENSNVIESNEDAAKHLKEKGAKVELKLYEGVGHGYPNNRDAELKKALKFVLEG